MSLTSNHIVATTTKQCCTLPARVIGTAGADFSVQPCVRQESAVQVTTYAQAVQANFVSLVKSVHSRAILWPEIALSAHSLHQAVNHAERECCLCLYSDHTSHMSSCCYSILLFWYIRTYSHRLNHGDTRFPLIHVKSPTRVSDAWLVITLPLFHRKLHIYCQMADPLPLCFTIIDAYACQSFAETFPVCKGHWSCKTNEFCATACLTGNCGKDKNIPLGTIGKFCQPCKECTQYSNSVTKSCNVCPPIPKAGDKDMW